MQNSTQKTTITKDQPMMRSVMMAPPLPMPLPAQRSLASASNKQYECIKTATMDCTWKVNQLTALPIFHILERTHVEISSVSPQQVAKRIADCFRTESILAEFDSAKACAKAETRDHIQIMVRLFQKEESILVEVQRLMGCSFAFHQIAQTVLNAARDVERQPNTIRRLRVPSIPVRDNQNQIVTECLQNVNNMLNCKRLDADVLAMETLSQLTHINSPYRVLVAQSILTGPLMKTVTRIIKSDRMDDTKIPQFSFLRRRALTILGDCLDALVKSDKIHLIRQQNLDICSTNLVTALLHDLKSSSVHPHEACEAARCFMSLIQCNPQIVNVADMEDAVSHAFHAGSITHSMLERESLRLQQLLLCH